MAGQILLSPTESCDWRAVLREISGNDGNLRQYIKSSACHGVGNDFKDFSSTLRWKAYNP